jgi:hypothetical protein
MSGERNGGVTDRIMRVVVVMGWVREAGGATGHCFPLTGLASLSKERGLATVRGLGACPPPQKLYLILRPCSHSLLARRALFTSNWPSGKHLYTAVAWR